MSINVKRPELLSPAGDFEKLKAAVRYGADAVYLAGEGTVNLVPAAVICDIAAHRAVALEESPFRDLDVTGTGTMADQGGVLADFRIAGH